MTMNENKQENSVELVFVIVNNGLGSKVLHKGRELGIQGGTVFLGKGTVNNHLLNFLSLYDEKREIVLMAMEKLTADHVLKKLNEIFQFKKSNHGIAFSTNLCQIVGSAYLNNKAMDEERGGEKSMYQLIITIVDRGKAVEVINAAKEAGAKGGTIINGRGSGIHETEKLFNMEIEPEKEMVLTVARKEIAKNIVKEIKERLAISQPGKGIVLVQDVNDVYGLYE